MIQTFALICLRLEIYDLLACVTRKHGHDEIHLVPQTIRFPFISLGLNQEFSYTVTIRDLQKSEELPKETSERKYFSEIAISK